MSLTARYADIVCRAVAADRPEVLESVLAEAFELGRELCELTLPPDEVMQYHHQAIVELAAKQPDLRLAQIAPRLTAPLLELSMAYGLAFRQQADFQQRHELQRRLEQASRLESIGTLAAGVAHDFNNILGSIIGFAEMTGDALPEASRERRNIEQIMQASHRARDLVARLLTFARQQPETLETVNVLTQVREALGLARASINSAIEMSLHSEFSEVLMLADSGHVQQIIMNLCLNAQDAMQAAGHIRLSIIRAPDSQGSLAQFCLCVRDSGSGMLPEIQAQVFNPFFTTKEPGKGSGLGLSVVHGIVAQLGGKVEIQSNMWGPERGTAVNIQLSALGLQPLQEKPLNEVF